MAREHALPAGKGLQVSARRRARRRYRRDDDRRLDGRDETLYGQDSSCPFVCSDWGKDFGKEKKDSKEDVCGSVSLRSQRSADALLPSSKLSYYILRVFRDTRCW